MTYEIEDRVARQARACGIRAPSLSAVRGRLETMLSASVRDSAVAGERAYGPYLFRLSGNRLLWVERRGPRAPDPGAVDECALCGGAMLLEVEERIEGRRATVIRPCPRVADPSRPRCDLATKSG